MFAFLGLGSILGSLAKVFASIVEVLTPIMKGLMEFLVWYTKAMFEGLKDVLDNLYTILFVFSIIVGLYFYLPQIDNTKVETRIIKEAQKTCPKFVSRKHPKLKSVNQSTQRQNATKSVFDFTRPL